MIKIPNKLVIFGAVAAAALVVPGVLGPLAFQEAEAARDQRNEATQTARENLVNVQAQVQANVDADVRNNNVCVIVETCQ